MCLYFTNFNIQVALSFFYVTDKIHSKIVSFLDLGDSSQFPIILMVVNIFSASYVFWITVWRANMEQSNFFWNKIKFEGFTIDFKGNKWLLWSKCLELDKKTSRGLKKSARTRTIKTPCELPAGAGKFPPLTRRNRRQSVPAEIFTCIRRYFYLRISVPAAFAGNFARASFTV